MIRQQVALPKAMTRQQASQIVRAASGFAAQLMLEAGERLVNAKSVLGMLSLASMGEQTAVLIADGADEEAAVQHLAALLAE